MTSYDHVEKKKTSDELNDVPANLNAAPTTSHIISTSNSSTTYSLCNKEADMSTGLSDVSTIPSSNLLHLDCSSSETSSEDESRSEEMKVYYVKCINSSYIFIKLRVLALRK